MPTWKSLTSTKRNTYPQLPTFKAGPTVSELNKSFQINQNNVKELERYGKELEKRKHELEALTIGVGAATGSFNNNSPVFNSYRLKLNEYNNLYSKYKEALNRANESANQYQKDISNYKGSNEGMEAQVKKIIMHSKQLKTTQENKSYLILQNN